MFCANSGAKCYNWISPFSFLFTSNNHRRKKLSFFQFECCGILGPTDEQVKINGTSTLIESCCENNNQICTADNEKVYTDGCASQLMEFLEENAKIIGGIAVGFAIFEVRRYQINCGSDVLFVLYYSQNISTNMTSSKIFNGIINHQETWKFRPYYYFYPKRGGFRFFFISGIAFQIFLRANLK